ncbi:MAG: DUF4367 domain-containing protein [Romboutsia sp.]|uniref:DUF4367 domain-containing protein n=1 Tax=Romboutsia sp. TaxID=1965302 RepID=UPI003F30B72A
MNNYDWKNAFPDTPKSFKNKVSATLNSLPEKEGYGEMGNNKIYKNGSFKRKAIVAIAATFVLGTTAFGLGKVTSLTSHSSNIPTYNSVPSKEELNKEFGFAPKIADKFENGYEFKSGHIVNGEALDEDGNTLDASKELSVYYKKDNEKNELSLNIANKMMGERAKEEVVVDTYNDIDLYYYSYANKFVPGDYKMTEQDKKDEASGKYVFSYGTDKIEVSENKFVSWEQDGIYYSLMSMDLDLSQDELVKMAHEMINSK